MNKDPLEELFGPLDETPTTPTATPVPARERLAYEQAERVRTAQLPMSQGPKGGAPGGSSGKGIKQAKPWIIVGIVAVVAIIASIVVVNIARGGEGDPGEATPTTAPTTAPTATPTTPSPTPSDVKPTSEKPDENTPPSVEVGETTSFPVEQWGASSQWPQRLGAASYALSGEGNAELRLTGDLFNSFPESCAAMRGEWGATRLANGAFEVAKPATKCAEAPELYDEVWGLVAAWTQTITAN